MKSPSGGLAPDASNMEHDSLPASNTLCSDGHEYAIASQGVLGNEFFLMPSSGRSGLVVRKSKKMSSLLSRLLGESCRKLGSERLTAKSATDHERRLRLALVSADVSYAAATDLAKRVVDCARGVRSRNPTSISESLVAVLTEYLTPTHQSRTLGGRIALIGANGAGKTTTCAKLAKLLAASSRVAVVACDLSRPAASEQLETMASKIPVDFFTLVGQTPKIRKELLANLENYDHVIFDTAGQQDTVSIVDSGLPSFMTATRPDWKILVCDSAAGQQALSLASYLQPLGIDGCILTKTDGDALGGAALSLVAATSRPILYCGTGECIDDLEVFCPERMAGRIMGKGDLAALANQVKKSEVRIPSGDGFDFNSMLTMTAAVRNMGGLGWMSKVLPGKLGNLASQCSDSSSLGRVEAIILSMSPQERCTPHLLQEPSRISRIAAGSGQSESEVLELVNRLELFKGVLEQGGLG